MSGLQKFQIIIKERIEIRKRVNEEIKWLITICQDISNRLEVSLISNIISKTIYTETLYGLDECMDIIGLVPFIIPLNHLTKLGSYSFAIKISKVKFKLINIIQDIGCCKLDNIIKLLLDITINTLKYSSENLETMDILNEYLNPISCEIYTLQTDNSFTLNVNQTVDDNNKLKLCDNQLKELSIFKLTPFIQGITLRLNGSKIYLPYNNTLLVINGYFSKTTQTSYKFYKSTSDKFSCIKKALTGLNINENFKEGYLLQLNLRDILLSNPKEIVDNCQQKHIDLKKNRNKSLSIIIKEFTNMEIDAQREIISNLLFDKTNIENIYVCFVLFDLLNQDKNTSNSKISDQVYKSLSWVQQQILNNARTKADMLTTNILKYTEDIVPYEKRILLMKCSNDVKSKALEKLKEINSSKGGESSSKAQQYIEGLIKIPFGIFKYEPIINFITDFHQLFDNVIDRLNSLNESDCETLISNDSSNKYINSANDINKILVKNYSKLLSISNNYIDTNLNDLTCKYLRNILNHISINKNGKKEDLITRVINNKELLTLDTRVKYELFNYNKFGNKQMIEDFITTNNKWNNYKLDRKTYLEDVDDILNSAVYGMDEPKQEMKRIIAQWINGSNEGYILGFEGPPGTGKTTLAKRGIARCLRDENGNNRPFTFIALGGSTNGSTLEGHNYTYVGSTWGRIVDALMETQCMNPIIYIDELDKISRTEHGKELIGILIHLTDPSQNEEFMDKYFSGIKIDISKCLIIFSYNDVNKIDRVLLDRIHRIKIDALTRYDKYIVAKDHLIPEICKNVGFKTDDISIDQETLFYIIDNYTFEAGARKLKEKLFDIIREINLKYLLGKINDFPQIINKDLVNEVFYKTSRVQVKKIPKLPSIGLVNGLYATSAGTGGITTIEAFRYLSDSRLSLELTGQQGDVMKESMRVSKTIAWNLLPNGIKDTIRKEKPYGIHIHCPEAAQPKDGPSAGTAITIAMLSLLSNIPVNNEIAVTGEIDLNGNVLAIGGLEYKIEGAKTAGVKLVLCPEENMDDLNKILNGKHNPTKNCDFKIATIKNIYQAIDYMLMGDDKCSSLFQQYSKYPRSHNDYLETFKSLCDSSTDLICIVDTSPDFLLLYASKGFNNKLGWINSDIYQKPSMTFINHSYRENFSKTLLNTINDENELCIRLRVTKKDDDSIVVICNTHKIDNIISCTMRIVDTKK